MRAPLLRCAAIMLVSPTLAAASGVPGLPHTPVYTVSYVDVGHFSTNHVGAVFPYIDLNGDGVRELLVNSLSFNSGTAIVSGIDGSALGFIEEFEAFPGGDADGDGVMDIGLQERSIVNFPADFKVVDLEFTDVLYNGPGSAYGDPLGDIDGDGFGDFIVYRPRCAQTGTQEPTGSVSFVSGALPDQPTCIIDFYDCTPPKNDDYCVFERSAMAAGDVNGDGIKDVLYQIQTADNSLVVMRVLSGVDLSLVLELDFPPIPGARIYSGADLNGDGFGDILRSDPNRSGDANPGELTAFSGADGTTLWTGTPLPNQHSNSGYASSVQVTGDLNGSGYPDVIVGASGHSGGGFRRGTVYFYEGLDGSLIAQIDGGSNSMWSDLASQSSGVGIELNDLDGDGIADFVLSARNLIPNGLATFTVYLSAGIPGSGCPGDCDASAVVDFNDLVAMLFEFGEPDAPDACDADASGAVDFNDLVTALFAFGACP